MRRRRYLVIFAKAPALGRVKTRLARGIGVLPALAFYRNTLATLLRRVAHDPRWHTVLAVAPDRAVRSARRWPRRVPRHGQGPGGLGRRMGRVMRQWPRGAVVIIGADIPDVTARHVARAFAALGHADAVFGPATDGGYWLVGAKGSARNSTMFDRVRWSTEHALADTLRNLAGRRVALIDVLDDVDDAAAHARWHARTCLRG
ncbi:MAG TPA: TIGR04282 family arsenosugar biosynthesis glycosyltransferase [Alphaproteobacteria bacterium]